MRTAWLGLGLGAILIGCEPVPPQGLDDVRVPDGFVLETARDVPLTVRLDPGLRDLAPHVRIALLDGRVLTDATLDADTTFTLRLPAGQGAVRVTADLGAEPVDERAVELGAGATVTLGGGR